jgi:hypothetical protein
MLSRTEQEQRVIELYQQGKTIREIARDGGLLQIVMITYYTIIILVTLRQDIMMVITLDSTTAK